jgi:uncharacterized repeat protein (TIGR01451 family)
VAAFTPTSVAVPINTPVVFTDTSTTDGIPLAAWSWDFGDGSTGSGSVVSHTFTAAGTYTVALTATDPCGYADQVIVPNAVTVLVPVLTISKTVSSSAVAYAPLTYTLSVSNTGNAAATSVVITDALPSGADYVGCSGGTCGESGGVVTWSNLTAPANQTTHVSFTVTAGEGQLVNSAYRVTGSAEGVTSPWGTPVTVTVQADNRIFLPLVLRNYP